MTKKDLFLVDALKEYTVMADGTIIGKFGKTLTPFITKKGYCSVTLWVNGVMKGARVHRLVAFAFHGPSSSQVNHIDGNKQNNHYKNLEYVTGKENAAHFWRIDGTGPHVKMTWGKVAEMRHMHETGEYSIAKLTSMFGLRDKKHAADIVHNRAWVQG